jgi:DNA-binding CsgD family transcriptional regulator
MMRSRLPLTDIENDIAELLAEGYTVKETAVRLVERGRHMAPSTVASRLRDIAAKVPNPHDLPPIAAITLYIKTRRAA